VRKALLSYKSKTTDGLWQITQDESQAASRRFQAAAALAQYAPDDERWAQTAPFVAQYLTNVIPPVYLGQWRQLFQPGSEALAGPLCDILADRGRSEKQLEAAALVLSDYLRDQGQQLSEVILVADEFAEYSPLVEALKPHAAAVKQQQFTELQAVMPVELAKSNDQLSETDQQRRDARWRRQSLAAVTLVHLGYGDEVWPLLRFSPDPSLRSFIIHYLGKLVTNANLLAAHLEIEQEVSIRRALVQGLGGLDSSFISPTDRNKIVMQLQSLYANDPDPGIHSSAIWTLRKWRMPEADMKLPDAPWNGVRRWYVNSQGQTMVLIPIAATDGEKPDSGHAISSHEVTVAEFRRFRENHVLDHNVVPTDACPVHSVTWYEAAEYCNWLNKQEGIPADQWLYEPNESGVYFEGMKIKEQSSQLQGYRLPTEAEWESACRSGTSGTYGFGEPVPLLKDYGWYATNAFGRSYDVESLLPNEVGLFDMHGNVWEWTQDPVGNPFSPVTGISRLLRGGSFGSQGSFLPRRDIGLPPTQRDTAFGFRLARTLPLNVSTSP
jgi:hypothetical protein